MIRTDWTRSEVATLYGQPLMELMHQAAGTHRRHNDPSQVQRCTLLSIKTGSCSEDCAYCPQSARYQTDVDAHKLMAKENVIAAAKQAKQAGASRFCMGAAWRHVKDNSEFDRVLDMVKEVSALELEVCCTLGMLDEAQATRLKEAGLTAYNHNLDTSRNHYPEIVTTRSYDERLETLAAVREAGIRVCCGGILGLGESQDDRIDLLHTLATLPRHPESVPINALVPMAGTPLAESAGPSSWEMLRAIAVARILMPKSKIRLSAGRVNMSHETQALCFMVGANSIFSGDKLLTTSNPDANSDQNLFDTLGIYDKTVPSPVLANS